MYRIKKNRKFYYKKYSNLAASLNKLIQIEMEESKIKDSDKMSQDEKIQMFLQNEKEWEEHPLNTRIHNPYQYVYTCDSFELLNRVKESLANIKAADDSVTNFYSDGGKYQKTKEQDLSVIISKIKNFEALLLVIIINLRHMEVAKMVDQIPAPVLQKFMKDNIKQEIVESDKFSDEEDLVNKLALINDEFVYIEKEVLLQFLYGKVFVWAPAVYCVLKSLDKVVDLINLSIGRLNEKDSSKRRKIFIITTHKLSRLFDLMYGAILDDPKSIFYMTDSTNPELLMLTEWMEFEMPEDIESHKEKTTKGVEDFYWTISIAQRGFRHETFAVQLASAAKWTVYYKLKKHKIWDHGTFMLSVLNKEAVVRVLKLIQSDYVEKKLGNDSSLPKILINKLFSIPITKEDLITLENSEDPSTPKMMTENLDLPIDEWTEGMDKTERIQVRLLCNNDWDRVNWKTNKLIDEEAEWAHLEAVILHIHGGGFIAGSSATAQANTRVWSSNSKYPLFSVDYRLSPEYKFPDAVNDCWQVYLWLIKYWKRYFQLTFDKIILIGDSAGGNLIIGVTALAIIKGWKVPDGLNLIYPAIALSRSLFSPSQILWLDDVYLSATFLSLWVEFYISEEFGMKKNCILSPAFLPDKILERFPPWRFSCAGQDPLRDDAFKFIIRLKKLGVDVKGTEYKSLMHAFLTHNQKPFCLEEAQKALDKIYDYIIELVSL